MKKKERVCLTVNVHPHARKPKIEKMDTGEFRIHVLAPPSRGEANKEVIETLASYFDLSPSRIRILRGHKSRRKIIALEVKNGSSQ